MKFIPKYSYLLSSDVLAAKKSSRVRVILIQTSRVSSGVRVAKNQFDNKISLLFIAYNVFSD